MLNPILDCVSFKSRRLSYGHYELESMVRARDEGTFDLTTVRIEQVLNHALRTMEHEGLSATCPVGDVTSLDLINSVTYWIACFGVMKEKSLPAF